MTKARQYMKDNHINGTIITLKTNGFEYMLYDGSCYYVPYEK